MPSKIGCTRPIFGIVIVPICVRLTGAYGSLGGACGCGRGSVVVVTDGCRAKWGATVVALDAGGTVRLGSSSRAAALLLMTSAVDAQAAATIASATTTKIGRRNRRRKCTITPSHHELGEH